MASGAAAGAAAPDFLVAVFLAGDFLAIDGWRDRLRLLRREEASPRRQIHKPPGGIDRIALGVAPGAPVSLRCGDVPLFEGEMGRKGQRLAVRIEKDIERRKGATS